MDAGLEIELANPLGIEPARSVLQTTYTISGALLGMGLIVSLGSLVLRRRRAWGDERQQLKRVAYAAALVVVLEFLAPLLPHKLFSAAIAVVPLLVPGMIGVAILKYRLYDIDRLINRTLVYGLLTALLGAVYAGVVLALGQLFGDIGDQPPTWAVAGATLTAAALFQPGRRRIQVVVDRRFNRRRYNATRTIEAFSARLREQVNLDTLSAELLTVVDQTMQPTAVSLWLRPPLQRARTGT